MDSCGGLAHLKMLSNCDKQSEDAMIFATLFSRSDPIRLVEVGSSSLVRDVEFRFCGRKMSGSARYEEWIDTVPDEFRERCQRSEKGVDIEICCDALHLAAAKLLDRLLLLTNDSDFAPLCRMLKQLGTNVSLIRLSEARPVNEELVEACDTYDVMDERHLFAAFGLSAAL